MAYPSIELAESVVLVTGGGRGIGRATGAAFGARGATVVLGDLDLPVAQEAAAGLGAHALHLDVTSRASFAGCVETVLDRFGRIDVLVNNAGVMPVGGFLQQTEALDATTLDVNIKGLIHGMRLVLPAMIERGSGHIVNVASMAAKTVVPGLAVYHASKFGALGLSLAVRREFAGTGVSVSAVLPSAVRTGVVAGLPLGAAMPTVEPEDVAAAVVGTVRTRRAETTVPRYLGVVDLVNALVPEPVFRLARRLLDDTRALTGLDHDARRDYEQRVADQAVVRELRDAEADRPS